MVEEIVGYIDKKDTIEGRPTSGRAVSVFDCAFRPANGERSLHYGPTSG